MRASAARFLLRRAPLTIAAASGASVAMVSQFSPPQVAQCKPAESHATLLRRTTSKGLNAKKEKAVDMKVGIKFLDVFKAEYKDPSTGEIDMSKRVDFEHTVLLLEGAGGRRKQAKDMFNTMDTEHSGYVTYSSVIAYFLNHATGTHNEKMSFLFHACDTDFTNKIEPHDLKVVVHHMMGMKMEADGKQSFFEWHPVLYADIPERCVLHLKTNEFVYDVFSNAHGHHGHEVTDKEELTEKEFIAWHLRGGKQAKRLDKLFNIDHMSHH